MGRVPRVTGNHIWGAVETAREKWNTATDTTSQPGTTKRPPYYFRENQGGGIPAADVVIIKDSSVSYASTDKGGPPAYMRINPTWAATLTQEQLAGVIAHELAHPLGLGNAYEAASGCQSAISIMNGLVSSTNPVPKYTSVQDRNVFQMNRQHNASTRGQCCADVSGSNTVYMNPADCADDDYDGVTACDGDCNDHDPSHTYDCSAGGCVYSGPEGGFAAWCDIDLPPSCSDGIDNDCNMKTDYQDEGCICPSPVVIDTAGDGFDLTDGPGGVEFDINHDGLKERLSWTAAGSDDAWLVLDRNGNGLIDDGGELFGNYSAQPPSQRPNGFAALAVFDAPEAGGNADGVIDAGDSIFYSLRLWRDANHDGVSQQDELHALPSLDIASVSLEFQEIRRRDRYGNGYRYMAAVEGTERRIKRRPAFDVFLVPGR